MHRVLVPVDRNVERAQHQAKYVTTLPGAPDDLDVRVVFVNEADYPGSKPKQFDDIEAATTVVDMIQTAGIQCEGIMREGNIAQNILDEADEFDADDIVMAGRDRSGVMKVLLGSVSQDVVVSTERPVTIVG